MLLEAKAIHKSYGQGKRCLHILKGVDLRVREGEVVVIVGPSGVGKSTLLHILGGLDKPSSRGAVILQGDDVYALKESERARLRNKKIGLVFQFYHLLPEFTALENVLLPLFIRYQSANVRAHQEAAEAVLTRVGLQHRMTHKPAQLSGGEQQRVAIARALINDPQLLLCDEPTGNLDSKNGQEVLNLLMRLNQEHNQTLIIVTHDENIASAASRVIHMKDGLLEELIQREA